MSVTRPPRGSARVTARVTARLIARVIAWFTVALVVAGCRADADAPGEAAAGPTTGSTAASAPAADDTGSPVVEVADLFSVLSPWNTVVADEPVHPDSAAMLARADGTRGLAIDTERAVPVVAGGVPTILSCRGTRCGDGDGADLVLDVPADVDPEPLDGGQLSVLDPVARIGYDFTRARREDDGSISYLARHEWQLDGPGFNQPRVESARGSGLPLFAGLVSPAELRSGRITHALAIALPAPAGDHYVQPASATDGTGPPGSVPEGARLRLRADVVVPAPVDPLSGVPLPLDAAQRRATDTLVSALQRYGAIVVGQAPVPTLYVSTGAVDVARPVRGYELRGLRATDLEVLDLGGLTRFPPDDGVAP